jgi:hypothetical protein
MKTVKKLIFFSISMLLFAHCGFEGFRENANQQFGDQHFKTAIALIELHKIRNGDYPESLDSIKFSGDWDGIAGSNVKYKKLANGYELDLVNGWAGKPEKLVYPPEFWKGLGLQKSNMKK